MNANYLHFCCNIIKVVLYLLRKIYYLRMMYTIGTAASQVFRMAVGMSVATGTLTYAVAVDFQDLTRIIKMSWMYRLIVPEPFHSPDGTDINKFRFL